MKLRLHVYVNFVNYFKNMSLLETILLSWFPLIKWAIN